MTDTSRELLSRFSSGSEEAAEQIFARYVHRLTGLARLRLSERIARRVDPEDIVLSAYRSFFVGARDGRFEVRHGGDLWRLLVSITMHKLHRQVAAHQTLKRSTQAESSLDCCDTVPSREPTPEEVLSASDELEAVLAELPDLGRRVLELRLQGETLAAIALETSRTERTVRRMIDLARDAFQRRLNRCLEITELSPAPIRASDPVPQDDRSNASHSVVAADPMKSSAQIISAPRAPLVIRDSLNLSNYLDFSDYTLQKFIGAGGSGKVYRAIQHSLDRCVAVKFLKKSFQRNSEIVDRFLAEAMTVARLNHPGIVRLHGLGLTPGGGYFVVMDWFPDGDLSRQIQNRVIPVPDAIRWVRDAALAIQYVHEQGIVHCDLKPGNLLLDERGRVRITDFGHARSMKEISDDCHRLEGTAGFMAIEQAAPGFGDIGPRTDIYGLGAVLYVLLTGRSPHVGNRPSDMIAHLIANRPFPVPSSHRVDIPPALERICLQCLNRDPSQRPASAKEVAERLGEVGDTR